MSTTNGDGRYAALEARLAAIETAHRILLDRWERTLTPRILAMERDLDRIAAELAQRPTK